MALEGRLQEFSAAEALGMIAREEKTGRLVVETPAKTLILHFARGLVTQARDPILDPDDSFLLLLREARIVSSEQWKALPAQRKDRDPVEHLIGLGVGTRAQFEEWLKMHAQSVLDQLLEAEQGSFRFESTAHATAFTVPLAEKSEFMVMEAGRRSDEANEYLATDLRPTNIPVMWPGQRPAPTDPFRGALLRLVDGSRTIGEMLATSALPRYELLALLKILLEREMCTLRVPARTRVRTKRSASSIVGRVIVVAVSLVVLAGSVYVGVRLWSNDLPFSLP